MTYLIISAYTLLKHKLQYYRRQQPKYRTSHRKTREQLTEVLPRCHKVSSTHYSITNYSDTSNELLRFIFNNVALQKHTHMWAKRPESAVFSLAEEQSAASRIQLPLNEPRSNKIHTETRQRAFEKTHRRTRDVKNNSEKHLNTRRKPKLKVSSWPSGDFCRAAPQPKQPEAPLKGFFCTGRLNRRRTQLCHWQRMSIHPARGLSGVLQHMWEQFRLLFFSRTSYACDREISEQQASRKFSATSYFPLCVTISLLSLLFQSCIASVIDAASAELCQSDSSWGFQTTPFCWSAKEKCCYIPA